MAPDETMWTPPDGFTLTKIPAHYLDAKGQGRDARPDQVIADGSIDIPHWDDEQPFAYTVNDGRGPNASAEARQAALDGKPLAGWNPNVVMKPIKDGLVPPQYVLTHDEDPTPKIEPALTVSVPDAPEDAS